MALPFKLLQLDFAGGLDLKRNPKQVLPAKVLKAENVIFPEPGTFTKRHGYTELAATHWDSSLTIAAVARALGVRLAELLMIADTSASGDPQGAAVLSRDAQGDKWTGIGRTNPVRVSIEDISQPFGSDTVLIHDGHVMPYVGVVANYALYASEINTGSLLGYYLRVVDTDTGARLYDQQVRSTGPTESPKVAAIGTKANIFVAEAAANDIFCDRWDSADPDAVTQAGAALVSDLNASGLWDACEVDGSVCALAYETSANDIDIIRVDATGAILTTATIAENPQGCVAVHHVTDPQSGTSYLFVAWQTAAAGVRLRYALLNPTTLATVFGPDDLRSSDLTGETVRNITAARESDTNGAYKLRWFAELSATERYNHRIITHAGPFDSLSDSGAATVRHLGLATKAFTYLGRAWVWAVHDSAPDNNNNGLQTTYFLLNGTSTETSGTPDYDAKLFYARAGGLSERSGLGQVVDMGSDVFLAAMLRQDQTGAGGAVLKSLVGVSVDMSPPAPPWLQLAGATYLGAGYIGQADGAFHEVGHHLFPENLSHVADTDGAGGLSDSTAYRFRAVYEWNDKLGNLHRSAPSVALVHTTGADTDATPNNWSITIRVPTLAAATRFDPDVIGKDKASDTIIRLYMTETGGTVYRQSLYWAVNDPDADYVDFEVLFAPTSSRPLLYTESGELENEGAPSAWAMAMVANRAFVVRQDARRKLGWSKEKVRGLGLEFVAEDDASIEFNQGGDINALGVLGETLAIFQETQVSLMLAIGGPNEKGEGDFNPPRLVAQDVGHVDPFQPVAIPAGLIFKSHKGFKLLTGGGVHPTWGADVDDHDSATVIDARVVESAHEVRFLLDGSTTMLVYDYQADQWSTHTLTHAGVAATVWGGDYCYLRSTGAVRQESSAVYQDAGTNYAMKVRTSWLQPGGPQAQCVLGEFSFLGDWKFAHTMTVRVYYDFDDSAPFSTYTFNAVASKVPYQFRKVPKKQNCTAVMFEFEDTIGGQGSGEGRGYTLSNLAILVAVPGGIRREALRS